MKRYIVLIFSDNKGKPSINFKPIGYGGFRHNEYNYIQRLPIIAKYLNRKAVFSKPWVSLCHNHNLKKTSK